ncbi:MAG: DUF2147 domain-containing protein [Bacteroidota bacterium]
MTLSLFFFLFTQLGLAQNSVEGIYWTPGKKGKIELYEQNGKICAKSVCCNNDKKDVNNPDPELRDRSTVGIEVMSGFQKRGKKTYTNGRIYNPKDGRTYRAKMWVVGDKIKVRGYVGSPILGRTVVCERAAS